jgi:hypothetical protein
LNVITPVRGFVPSKNWILVAALTIKNMRKTLTVVEPDPETSVLFPVVLVLIVELDKTVVVGTAKVTALAAVLMSTVTGAVDAVAVKVPETGRGSGLVI